MNVERTYKFNVFEKINVDDKKIHVDDVEINVDDVLCRKRSKKMGQPWAYVKRVYNFLWETFRVN